MAISINQLKAGMGLLVDGTVYIVSEYHHVKPGKGGAFVRVKLRNLKTDLVIERTFKTADKLEEAFIEEKKLQYLYRAGDTFHFMDQATFEEVVVPESLLEETIEFLQENSDVAAIFYNHQVQKILLPNFIVASIVEAEPGFKGDSARAGTKPARIETGATVQVPLFINKGELVKVDTRTGQYVERVQK